MTIHNTLVVENLQKNYKKHQVVQDISMEMCCGETVGLLGPNGAGKTTAFYMIVGLVPPDKGKIYLRGTNISSLSMHKRATLGLSYLPQEPSIFRNMTVEENIRAVLELQRLNKNPLSTSRINERLEELLHELKIEGLRGKNAAVLSGGERRRVEIARTLCTRPCFILLDEPFSGVDPITVIEIQRIIHFLKECAIGVLITDHNVRETLSICDRAYIVDKGSILASGPPDDVISNHLVQSVYLGKNFRM